MNAVTKTQALEKMARDFAAVSGVYNGADVTSPYEQMKEWRAKTPVLEGDILRIFKAPSQADWMGTGRKVYTVFRYKDVHQVLRDDKNWLSKQNAEGFGSAVDNFLLTGMDGEEHHKWRAVLQPPMMPSAIKKWKDNLICPIIEDEFIGAMRPKGKADLLLDFVLAFPVRVVYKMFGLPDDMVAAMQSAGWALQIVGGPRFDPEEMKTSIPAAMEAGQRLYEYVLPAVQERRKSGIVRDDMIGFLMGLNVDGKTFTDEDITTFIRMTLLAAGETTSRSFWNMIVLLLERPYVWERLLLDRSLIPKAVVETMRLETVAGHLGRLAARDMEIGGVTIKKDEAVTVCISSANRDPEVYENPDELILDRPMRPVMSFGFGPHICMGMHLAKLEMEIALNAMLDLPNFRLDPDYPKPVIRGIQLRGPDQLHVKWDVA